MAVGARRVTLYLQPDNSITVDFDPGAMRATNIILETPPSADGPGEWITDVCADGVPDMRRIKGRRGNELFYEGHWYSSTPAGSNTASIAIGGAVVNLSYDGHRWVEAQSAKGSRP